MGILTNIVILSCLLVISYQDFKERMVWAFLFPLLALSGGYLFFLKTDLLFFITAVGINLTIVAFMVGVIACISKFVLQKKLFSEVLGLGDILLFIALAVSFPTLSFLNFFVFSVLFTYVISKLLKLAIRNYKDSVPLAGGMSLFLSFVFVLHWTGLYPEIYML